MNENYFVTNGEHDELRLNLLNTLYNKLTLNFLINQGLKPGMRILEYGCGYGYFAIELAQYLGPNGMVVARDSSPKALEIAINNAKLAKLNNIEFKCCNIESDNELLPDDKFDFIYGRWVLIFCKSPQLIISKLSKLLKNNAKFVSEELNFLDSGHFSYPEIPEINQYHKLVLDSCINNKFEINLANKLYSHFVSLGFNKISLATNQAVLVTPQEKSVYRLGIISMAQYLLQNKLCPASELTELIKNFQRIEQESGIIGGFRNILVSGSL